MSDVDIKSQVYELIAAVMRVPAGAMPAEVSPKTIPQWDSLKHMNLVLAAEQKFNIAFSDEDIVGIEDAASLIAAVKQKKGG